MPNNGVSPPVGNADGKGDIASGVRKILADVLEVDDPMKIDLDADLVEDLGMDSMMALEILATLEKQFRIKIPERNLPKMTSLKRIVEVTEEYVRP